MTMSIKEQRSLAGKAGKGKSKIRGDKNYYKRISKLAAEARKRKREQQNEQA